MAGIEELQVLRWRERHDWQGGPSRRRALARSFLGLSGIAVAAWVWPMTAQAADDRFPDVLKATVRAAADGRFDFDVTIASPDDTPARCADGFRVSTLKGVVLGERTPWHDHQHEQTFTRDLYGVAVPAGMATVRIQARDQQHGYGGVAIEVSLPSQQP
jgi:hypothetical protein